MQHYWINDNGQQQGPFTIEELKQLKLSEKAYVWFNGMSDWVKVCEVPELADALSREPFEAMAVVTVDTDPEEPEIAAEAPQPSPVPPFVEPQQSPVPPFNGQQPPYGAPQQYNPQQQYGSQPSFDPQQQPIPEYAAGQPMPAEMPKCPPSNLWWGVGTTLLCCLPLGLAAIFMSFKVGQCYNAGDYEGSEKWSERTAWMCIASIIFGIIMMPLQLLFSLF